MSRILLQEHPWDGMKSRTHWDTITSINEKSLLSLKRNNISLGKSIHACLGKMMRPSMWRTTICSHLLIMGRIRWWGIHI